MINLCAERMEVFMKQKASRLESIVDMTAKIISSTAFIGMVLLISMNVFSRYVFNLSFNWAEELAYLLFNWTVFFGVAILYRYQGLTAIDALVNHMSPKVKRVALIFNYSILLAITSCLVVWGYVFAMNAWVRKSPSLHIPYFYYDISIPLACIILAGYSLKFLIMTIKGEQIEEVALEFRS